MRRSSAQAGEPMETDFLVLRSTLYGENGSIVGGLSPDLGRLSFMVHGGRGGRGGAFGLFRRLHVRFHRCEREIQNYDEVELIGNYDAVSQDYPRYVSACWLSRLCLLNAMPGVSAPCFFASLEVAFRRLASGEGCIAAIETGVLLVCLEENGWLPSWNEDSREELQCRKLLEMGMGGEIPSLQEGNWRDLRAWSLGLLAQTECMIPNVPEQGGAHAAEH